MADPTIKIRCGNQSTCCLGLVSTTIWLLIAAFASAQSSDVEEITQQIQLLGSSKYRLRERTTRDLISLGVAALPQVEANLSHPDAEIRRRCRRIADEIISAHREVRIAGFLAGRDDAADDLPGWQRICEITGDTVESRALLGEVLQKHWSAIFDFENSSSEPTPIVISLLQRMEFARSVKRRSLSVADVTAALLIADSDRVKLPSQILSRFLSLLHQLTRAEDGSDPWSNACFRYLAGSLIKRCTEPNVAYQGCSLALRHELTEGIVPAMAIIENESSTPNVQQYAILTVARFGDPADIAVLEPLIDNQTVCYRRTNSQTKDAEFECQIRDVALAAVIHLLAQDPRQFGYLELRRNSYSVFQPHSLGFVDPDQRDKALNMWFAYRQASKQ